MVKINLFPTEEIKRKKEIFNLTVANIVIFLIVAGVIVGMYLVNLSKIERIDREISQEKHKLQKLTSLQKKIKEFRKKKEILDTKLRIINNLNSNRLFHSYLFYVISHEIPQKLWLNYMKIDGKNIELKGIAMDEPTVVQFIKNLKNQGFFSSINLMQINQRVVNNLKLKEFYLLLEVNFQKLKGII